MTIIPDGASGGLPPLVPRKEPLMQAGSIVAVDTVRLIARDVPIGRFRAFYVEMLGFSADSPGEADFAFRLEQRRVEFIRTPPPDLVDATTRPGRLYVQLRLFGDAIRVLTDLRTPFELEHYDLGICRAALVMDPGGNLVTLLETREM